MKRIGGLIAMTVLALHAGAWNDTDNSIELTQLYIVGDATPKGWDLGGADAMHRIDAGVFEWTGCLEADKEFKFMNTREWQRHIVGMELGQYVDKDPMYPLCFYSDWSLPNELDKKLHVAETGTYTVYVDLNTMQMKVTDPVVSAQWPERFYISGSAVCDQVVALPSCGDVEYKAVVTLAPGSVKLMDTPTETAETRYFRPLLEDVDILFGKDYHSPLYECDGDAKSGWNVTVAGDYALYLDKGSKTYGFQTYQPRNVLYIVGGCCERAWNYWDDTNNRFYPSPDDPDILVWEGELRIGWDKSSGNPPEPNKFKLLTAQSWTMDTYHPYQADISVVGVSGARITGGDDIKWTIDQDGLYRLEFNTRTETLTGTLLNVDVITADFSTTETSVESIYYEYDNETTVYYTCQGLRIGGDFKGPAIAVAPSGARKIIMR